MPVSHFDKLVDEELLRTAESAMRVELGNSHKLAKIQGFHEGLTKAKELFRQASRTDVEDADL